jgi:hypothetical protein
MHKQRMAMLGTGIAGMMGTFLPWATVSIGPIAIITVIGKDVGDGWITLALFIPVVVLALMGDKKLPLLSKKRLGAVIPAGLALLMGIYEILNVSKIAGGGKSLGGLKVTVGFGLYLIILMSVAVIVSAFVLGKETAVTADAPVPPTDAPAPPT